ncbi:hypothetical protein AVEN_174537-1 [Araneus ventricosus]|uniref:Uncharacterized protein n=1 Tax=Araneus ventricosus TaxID=182803 RepID=A0A4Y2HXJ3_ARAVE|nr:hypothetical protein AVEN_174537-1 [Araneus ventricosus]
MKEVLNASLMSLFGSDVPVVLTSMQEKDASLMGQDRGCRPVIQSLPSQARSVFFCAPCCVGSCIIVQEQDPSTQDPWSGPTAPSDFLFSYIEVNTIGTSLPNKLIKLALRTSFNRCTPIFTRMVS